MSARKAYLYDPRPQPARLRKGVRFVAAKKRRKEAVDPLADQIPEGAQWWLGRSRHKVETLQRLFARGEVASVLYERIGAIVPAGPAEGGRYPIKIQVVAGENFVDLCLSEIGVVIDELIA